jgi:predicted RNA-binding protein with PUA-like domain
MTPQYWFLQANPRLYDIDTALTQLDRIWWRIPQYRSQVRVGDVMIVWRSGKEAGIVGIGRVIEEPQVHGADPTEAKFIRSASNESDAVVRALILVRPVDFVPKGQLAALEAFESHRIIKAPMGTIFAVAEDEWPTLAPLLPDPPD